MTVATQAFGTVLIFEKMFESRLFFTDKLVSMGARIILCDPHRVVVSGPAQLFGQRMESPDIRAGMSMLLASLCAEGQSTIGAVYQIDKGYERIDERLRALGARIERVAGWLGLLDGEDPRGPGAARRLNLDGVALAAPEHRTAERRVRRHRSGSADARDLDLHAGAVVVFDLHARSDADLARVQHRLVDQHRVLEPRAQGSDARLEQALLVLRRVILEVLRQVAVLARSLDRLDDRLAARALELRELGGERLALRCRQLIDSRLAHGHSIGRNARRL